LAKLLSQVILNGANENYFSLNGDFLLPDKNSARFKTRGIFIGPQKYFSRSVEKKCAAGLLEEAPALIRTQLHFGS